MIIHPSDQTKQENYKLLIGSILPRPIAFITTVNDQGVVNAAPFSYFNIAGTEPPIVTVAFIRKEGGVLKDTPRNIIENKEFVIHVVDGDNVYKVNQTSTDYPSEMSEVEAVGFTLVDSHVVKVPSIKESKLRMECRLHQAIPLGGSGEHANSDLIIGEIVCFDIADELYSKGKISTELLNPIGRLAGTTYGKIGETFSLPRESYKK